ncbi:MAG: alpha/beta hydrolase [Deltaproteobacteria bacterium]|nr:alpha/beta hydrolase [Deltaproteobacteria bacterium]
MALAPFEQLAFADVPEAPRVPHRWADTTRRDVTVRTDELGSIRIAVREYGSGPPLLLVHGLMWTSYSFRYLLEPLGARFRLVMPDLPGAGDSDHPDVYLGPDVLARALLATVDALDLRGSAVVGNSMGGYLSMRAALLDPKAFTRLVNLHSPGLPTPRMVALRWAMRVLPSFRIVDRLVRKDPERWVHRNVHYYDETLKSREEHREIARPLTTPAGRRTFYRHLRDTLDTRPMKQFASTLRASGFPIPLLLVYADRDPIVPPAVGARLRELLPSATFIELREASHFAHVDAPGRFVDAITPFLSA